MNIELKYTENLTDEEFEMLEKLVEKASVKKLKVFKPERESQYYIIEELGDIVKTYWLNDSVDKGSFVIGNCFKTYDNAEFALEKQKVLTELKRYALEHNDVEIDWENYAQTKYFICINSYRNNSLIICHNNVCADIGQIYFTSQEIAESAIEEIGAERIKKYLFGVELR